jgi:hypothetical protein
MPIDPKKKRIVFLTHDQIWNLKNLSEMHLNENGAPKILQVYALSEEYAESLKSAVLALQKVLNEIWEAEGDDSTPREQWPEWLKELMEEEQ